MRSTEAADLAGVSYRQLDLWCRRGWIVASRKGTGSGKPRDIDEGELRVLQTLARLVEAGVRPEVAAQWARSLAVSGSAVVVSGEGLRVVLRVQADP